MSDDEDDQPYSVPPPPQENTDSYSAEGNCVVGDEYPAPYEDMVQKPGPPPYDDVKLDVGWVMWRFDGMDWELLDDRSSQGAMPSTPSRERGKFVGQIVRTPSTWHQQNEPAPGQRVLDDGDNLLEVVHRAKEIPGYASDNELRWIIGTAASLPQGSIWVEVGALCGRSFLAAGLSLPPDCTLITIDRYLGQSMRRGQSILETYRELSFERWDINLVMTRAESVDAAGFFVDGSCSVVYLDGDHSGPAVKADIRAWAPKLIRDGLLCGHDYGRKFPGVTETVDQLPGSAVAVDSIWVWSP